MTSAPTPSDPVLRCGRLSVDLRSEEAWKDGEKLPLQHQSLHILAMLMERPGEIVTREELQKRLWPDGTFVDFDHSLNTAVKKLRQALGDSAEQPQFIETLPRIGYRLIAVKAQPSIAREPFPRPKWRLTVLVATLAVVAILGVRLVRNRPPIRADASTVKISRLTALGNVVQANISRDGKFVSYGIIDQGLSSLWLQQIGTAQVIQLLPPTSIGIWSTQFTPDGKFVYYAMRDPKLPEKKLYRIPSLGGDSTEILTGIESGKVAFSPDGSKMAYLRANYPTPQESAILIANADGTESKVIATRRQPERFAPIFFSTPSWSPDGQWITAALVRRVSGDPQAELIAMRPDGSAQKQISDHPFLFIGQSEWLPDMSGLLVVAADQRPVGASQVWLFPYPKGEPKRITNDFLGHRSVSLSADGSRLVTVAMETDSAVWRVPLNAGGRETKLTHFRDDGFPGLDAAPDGEVVYASFRDNSSDLYRIDAKAMTHRIPLIDGRPNAYPAVSRRGDLAFQSDDAIYTSRLDGSQLRKLTSGIQPAFTPDGNFVVFQKSSRGRSVLFKVPLQGGAAVQLTDYPAWFPRVSPDGKHIAAFCRPAGEAEQPCVIPIEGGLPIKHFPYVPQSWDDLDWAPDGKGILLIGSGQANIYLQPLDGSPARRVTNLENFPIFTFAVAHDGQSLLVARGRLSRDALLITGFH